MKHRDRHPVYVEGCYPCKLLSIHVDGDALITRKAQSWAAGSSHKQWDRDLDAFRAAAKDGLKPERSTEKASRAARRAAGDMEVVT